jgi:hypothetical protein
MTPAEHEQYSDAPKHCPRSLRGSGVETVTTLSISWDGRFFGRTPGGSIPVVADDHTRPFTRATIAVSAPSMRPGILCRIESIPSEPAVRGCAPKSAVSFRIRSLSGKAMLSTLVARRLTRRGSGTHTGIAEFCCVRFANRSVPINRSLKLRTLAGAQAARRPLPPFESRPSGSPPSSS